MFMCLKCWNFGSVDTDQTRGVWCLIWVCTMLRYVSTNVFSVLALVVSIRKVPVRIPREDRQSDKKNCYTSLFVIVSNSSVRWLQNVSMIPRSCAVLTFIKNMHMTLEEVREVKDRKS